MAFFDELDYTPKSFLYPKVPIHFTCITTTWNTFSFLACRFLYLGMLGFLLLGR